MTPLETPQTPVVVSLVIRMRDELQLQEEVYEALRSRPEIEVGEAFGPWLPVVVETGSPREVHAWLETLPGVAFVDVTFVEVVPEAAAETCSGDFSQETPLK
ncbi:MAG: hypothetical protein QM715_00975 [Nibricoccus sp.]